MSLVKVTLLLVCSLTSVVVGAQENKYSIINNPDFDLISTRSLNELVNYYSIYPAEENVSYIIHPYKFTSFLTWPGSIQAVTVDLRKKYLDPMIDIVNSLRSPADRINTETWDEFINLFNYFVDIPMTVVVNNNTEITRTLRLFLQDGLMQYIYKELKKDDTFITNYNLNTSLSSEQILSALMVAYGETVAEDDEYAISRAMEYNDNESLKKIIQENKIPEVLKPKFSSAYTTLGYNLINNEKYQEALIALQNSLLLDSKNSYAYFQLAYANVELEQYKEALKNLDSYIKLKPKDINAFIEQAFVYLRLKDYKRAIISYTNALKISENFYAYLNRARAYLNLKDSKKAINNYKKAESLLDQNSKGDKDLLDNLYQAIYGR